MMIVLNLLSNVKPRNIIQCFVFILYALTFSISHWYVLVGWLAVFHSSYICGSPRLVGYITRYNIVECGAERCEALFFAHHPILSTPFKYMQNHFFSFSFRFLGFCSNTQMVHSTLILPRPRCVILQSPHPPPPPPPSQFIQTTLFYLIWWLWNAVSVGRRDRNGWMRSMEHIAKTPIDSKCEFIALCGLWIIYFIIKTDF